jgi:hypothetical protein
MQMKITIYRFCHSDAVKVGEWVLALEIPTLNIDSNCRNCFGESQRFEHQRAQSFIQTDGAVN